MFGYNRSTSVQEIEAAITRLPSSDFTQLLQWQDRFQADASDHVSRDTAAMRARLMEIVQEHEADRWLSAPNPLLDGLSPRDAIVRGQTEQVSETLVRLEEGIYV